MYLYVWCHWCLIQYKNLAQNQPFYYHCLTQMILLVKGEPLGGKGLTGPICTSLFLNSFPPSVAKTALFVTLLCLTPDDFTPQGRTSGWERDNSKYQQGLGWGRITICLQIYIVNRKHLISTSLKSGYSAQYYSNTSYITSTLNFKATVHEYAAQPITMEDS